MVIIEPNDRYNWLRKIEDCLRKTTGKGRKEDFWWEEVGNFGYSFSVRELKKLVLGYGDLELYFKLQNDVYIKGVEKIEMGRVKKKYMHIWLQYNLKKNILNTLIKLGLIENNLILAVFMHRNNLPQQKTKFHGWEQVKLPASPYLNEKYDMLY